MRWRAARRSRSIRDGVSPAGYDSLDEYDTAAEVDAAFRTLRRGALGHFAVFLVAVGGVPGLTLTLDWWSEGRLIGGMSPGFVMAAFGFYIFFWLLGLAAASLSTAVEARMLGGQETDPAEREGGA